MSVNGNSGNYAPLKQILTESDSDDEHKLDDASKAMGSCNNLDINSGLQPSKNISLSDMEDFNTNENTVESTMDNVSFLQSDVSNKMSFPRRCAFIASILVCLFTVVIFLWGIPCSELGSCPNNEWHDRTTSWELPYEDIELSGSIQVVEGVIPNTKNLIFIYRGNHMAHQDENNRNVNGVLLIVGNSGKIGWYTREERIPTEINCHLIDVNRDKQKDCIVSGSQGLLAALNPMSGTYYWYIHKHGNVFSKIVTIDFPILIKDMDRDRVNDLLTVATVEPNASHNSLLMISGATGNIIGEPMPIDDCLSVKLLTESDLVNITYLCKNGSSEAVRGTSYSALNRTLAKLDLKVVSHVSPITKAMKKQKISLKKSISNTRETVTNGPGKLTVDNSGECPKCKVTLRLYLDRNNSSNVSWEYTANYVYAMKPSSFAFANNIRGPMINVSSISPCIKYENFTAHDISERIVLVSFDNIQTHNVNVSQTDIVQICVRGPIDSPTPQPLCQPDLDYQENSMMIADLDGDQSHELISYYSSFVAPDMYTTKKDDSESYDLHLMSVVRVIRLESELPKLFVANNV